jgi:RimJ/RimL family protein N-acetyltransferase
MIWFQLRVVDVYQNRFSMEIMDGHRHIGDVSNWGVSNPKLPHDALCSWIMQEYRGRGIVTRAFKEYMKVFGPGKTYQCVVNDDNIASQKVKDKLGFDLFCQDVSFWDYNGKQWTERGRRTYVITYQGVNHVQLSNAA